MNTLGIDPGLAHTGIALVRGGRVEWSTTIRTRATGKVEDRIAHLTAAVRELLEEAAPALVAIEGYGWQGHARTANRNASLLPRIVGNLEGLARSDRRPVVTLSRAQILVALCGSAGADKATVQRALAARGMDAPNEHERDAIAVALVGRQYRRLDLLVAEATGQQHGMADRKGQG